VGLFWSRERGTPLTFHRHHVPRLAAAAALWLTLSPCDALAQLRLPGGGGGGLPLGTGIGSGLPGPQVGIGAVDNPVKDPLMLPALSVPLGPAPTGTLTDTLNGPVTGTVSNVTHGAANTVNRAGQNLANAKQALPARRSGVPPVGERRYVPNEVVVTLPSTLSPQALDALARRHGLVRLESESIGLTGSTFHRWRIAADARSVSDVIRALEADGGVRTAQPNYRFTLQQGAGAAAAPRLVEQYAVDKLELAQAHRMATGNNCLIAVIDSGVDTAHPEIAAAIAEHFDAADPAAPPDNHGTAIAGAIAAHAQLTGVAPTARILAIRAFAGSESTTLAILKGIDWAVARGAQVINMSFAGPQDPEIGRVLAAARKKGVLLVAAAGNAGPQSPPLYPAADPNVIAVTATDADDRLLKVANRGRHIAVAAPGVDIVVPATGGGYQVSSGTSVAAAHVSGIAALLLEVKPGLSPDAVRKVLQSTAKDLGPKGRDDQFGAGLANAYRAVRSLRPDATPVAASTTR
jgi:Subtilase family/Fervidolysin N-terminal prodomain